MASGGAPVPIQACLVAPQLVVACMVTRQAAAASACSGKVAQAMVSKEAVQAGRRFMAMGFLACLAKATAAARASTATAVPGSACGATAEAAMGFSGGQPTALACTAWRRVSACSVKAGAMGSSLWGVLECMPLRQQD